MYTLALIGWLLSAFIPGDDLLRSILFLTGTADAEQLDEEAVERYEALAAHPVRLNGAPRRRLAELLSPYQMASLEDYRKRFGDVLSAEELALVDGFGRETARALAPFVSFAPSSLAGAVADTIRCRHSAVLRGARSAGRTAWGGKYRFSAGDRFEAAIAARKSYSEPLAGTAYLCLRNPSGKLVLGDFNARFGQGTALWTGFYLSSAGSLDAFARKPGGIVPAWSYAGTGCCRGIAADWQRGRMLFSAFAYAEGLKERMEAGKGTVSPAIGANALLYGLKGQGSLTFFHVREGVSRLSLDGRRMLGAADCFGEVSVNLRNGRGAAVAGCSLPVGEFVRFGLRVRTFPTAYTGAKTGDYSLATGVEYNDGQYVTKIGRSGFGASVIRNRLTLTAEGSLLPVPEVEIRRLFRGIIRWQGQLSPSWSLDVRISERWRSYSVRNRTDIRCDAAWSDGVWTGKGRINAVWSRSTGVLGYLEAGRTSPEWSVWLRGTLFRVDSWDDRIWSYERDAPGNFNVPAYYGRGYAVSANGGLKRTKWGARWKLYARVSLLSYPFMEEKKPGKAELKLQGMVDF